MADRRLVRLGLAVGTVVVTAVILIVATRRPTVRRPVAVGSGSAGSGSAGVPFVPKGPALPTAPAGIHLGGVVVDGSGAPVVGAIVTADLEETANAAVIDSAPSAADGRFALEGLGAGRYRLRVAGTGLVPAQLRYVAVPADETRIVVARQVRVDGTVVDGVTPIANAVVGLRGDAIGGSIETQTDATGAFHFPDLPEGLYQVYAAKAALVARAVRVPRIGAGPFLPVALKLEAGTIVVGRVVDRDEGTGLFAAVELRPATDDEVPRYARTDETGVFRIEGVPHGVWLADAYAPGFTSPGGIELEAGVGTPELGLQRGAMLEGRVLDAAGQPLANATVRALAGTTEKSAAVDQDTLRRYAGWIAAPAVGMPAGSDPQLLARGELGVMIGPIPPIPPPGAVVAGPITTTASVVAALAAEPAPLPVDAAHTPIWTTGTDGRYRIPGVPRGKVAALAVLAGLAEGRSRSVTVEAGQVLTDLDITLAAGTMIAGTITDQHGYPVTGATIHVTPDVGTALDAFTDATGGYRLGPVTGTIEIIATAYGHTGVRRTLELAPVPGTTAAESKQDFTLEVADAVLAGTIDDATGAIVASATLEVVGGPSDGRRAVANADGTFSIDLLPAGPLRVRVRHPDYPTAILDATASPRGASPARLRIPLGGAVEGVVLDADSGAPLANLALAATGPGGATADVATGEDGRWRLGPLVPGAWLVAIKQPGYLAITRAIDVRVGRAPGETTVRDIRIDLARGATLAGTVRDGRGTRVVGAAVTVQRVDGTGPKAEAVSNSQGEFRVRDVPTGDVDVVVMRGDGGGSMRVTLRPGDELLTLELTVR